MKEYKEKSGIYQIKNTINGKMYVGKTKCFYKRYCQYVSDARTTNLDRLNQYLANAFNKYGFDSFEFSVLEFCSVEDCAERELFWITKLGTLNRDIGYNLRLDSSTGMITHEDTSLKISNNLREQWSNGIRDGHADKLKISWENRDREAQAALFSETLTKYTYVINYPDGFVETMLYSELKDKGFKNVIATFHKKQCDTVNFKNVIIERKRVCNKKSP